MSVKYYKPLFFVKLLLSFALWFPFFTILSGEPFFSNISEFLYYALYLAYLFINILAYFFVPKYGNVILLKILDSFFLLFVVAYGIYITVWALNNADGEFGFVYIVYIELVSILYYWILTLFFNNNLCSIFCNHENKKIFNFFYLIIKILCFIVPSLIILLFSISLGFISLILCSVFLIFYVVLNGIIFLKFNRYILLLNFVDLIFILSFFILMFFGSFSIKNSVESINFILPLFYYGFLTLFFNNSIKIFEREQL